MGWAANDISRAILKAIEESDVTSAIDVLDEHPKYVMFNDSYVHTWLHRSAKRGLMDLCDYLLSHGLDINHESGVEKHTPVEAAISADEQSNRVDIVQALLQRGADPNISRPIISAINPRRGTEEQSLELVRLLVEEGGADVNRVYDVYGNPENTFTALDFAKSHERYTIVEYLKSKGAVED